MVEQTIAMFAGLAVFNLLAWSPVLLFSSVRRLFSLYPTDKIGLNYLIGMGGFTVLHFGILVATVVALGGMQGLQVLRGLAGISLAVGLIGWTAAGIILPKIGYWNPGKEDELDGRIALFLGLIWYMVSTGIGLFLMMAVMIGLFFPG
ncbi:MAG: hypothetical protein ABEJ56_04970 [Candidatus Nanohaloarchaea archaeon]